MQTIEIEIKKETDFSLVRFEGLSAYTDIYVAREDTLMLLSLFGSRVSVRAIWSALFSGSPVSVENESLRIDGKESWQVFQKITPSGFLHAVCFPKLIDLTRIQSQFVVLGETREDIETRFYLYLDRVSETPIRREWSAWIFKKALCDEKAKWLKSLNLFAVQYRHEELWLENQVTEFLKIKKQIAV